MMSKIFFIFSRLFLPVVIFIALYFFFLNGSDIVTIDTKMYTIKFSKFAYSLSIAFSFFIDRLILMMFKILKKILFIK